MKRKSTIRKIGSPIARDLFRLANSCHHIEIALQKIAEQEQLLFGELKAFRNGQKQLDNFENLESHINSLLDARENLKEGENDGGISESLPTQ